MAILCDFTVIRGDSEKRIGDGATLWEKNFNTNGRLSDRGAILMFMVKGLTAADTDVDIKINNKKVGEIEHYNGASRNHWFTQIINIGGANLKDGGKNEIQIEAVNFPGSGEGNLFDDFYIRDVVCFFHQKS